LCQKRTRWGIEEIGFIYAVGQKLRELTQKLRGISQKTPLVIWTQLPPQMIDATRDLGQKRIVRYAEIVSE